MKTMMLRTIVTSLGALALAGCVSLGGDPPPSLISLTSEATPPVGGSTTSTGETAITVVEPSAPARLSVTRVPVQVDDSTVQYLKDAVWVEKPTRLFRRVLADTLAAKTGRVVMDGADPDFSTRDQLRGTLVDFGYDARTSSVVVRFEAIRETGADTVTKRRFESIVPGVLPEVGPVGSALNRAANDVAGQVADWVAE